ncbi:hypothetical protein SAMN04488544_0850 [Microlunatus sagamiharensis]|uniref:Uncharacterized protein n=1 Tax=Microlunatus sagamiharensis TaxID=546874 RepID=A0A1H2LU26_9ACTN|nr:hypothetical protein [Microlunatus sagamiharensis]SDU84513.1 hypothetical protein SAMN04488544_0850 [Microlunatus sagamiharensis]
MVTVPEPARRATSLPATVLVAAVLAFAEAVVLLAGLAGVLLTLGRLSLGRPGSLGTATLVPVLLTAVLVPLVLAVAAVLGGVGVLVDRPGARVLLTVTVAVAVVGLGLVGLVGALTGPGVVTPTLGLSLALSLAVLVLLWVPASRAWFVRTPR